MTVEFERPEDVIYFDQGYSWPEKPHVCTPSCDHAVITHILEAQGWI